MQPDAASPLVIDTRELVRRPGTMREVSRVVECPERIGTDVIGIEQGEQIDLDLRLESVVEGVLLSGTVTSVATGACVRCLDPVEIDLDVDLQELFAYADRASHHREVAQDDDEDLRVLQDDLIDLDPVLRDAVVPTLPFQPTCREDCPGLCSECGDRLEDDPDHGHDIIDPRWAGLAGLMPDLTGGHTDQQDNDERRN